MEELQRHDLDFATYDNSTTRHFNLFEGGGGCAQSARVGWERKVLAYQKGGPKSG